jgi:hypothetical protein
MMEDFFPQMEMSNYSAQSQPKFQMNNIPSVSVGNIQDRVEPRLIGTGNSNGAMTIRGQIRVVDSAESSFNPKIVIGYKKGGF